MNSMGNVNLEQLLARIDVRTTEFAFSPPASSVEIRKLSEAIEYSANMTIPEELRIWFHWHNGQDSNECLFLDDNRRFLSITESIEAWNFFLDSRNDFLVPYDPFWFPLQSNGRSDYLVYDLKSGNLIGYWHDDKEREIEYRSLTDWAKYAEAAPITSESTSQSCLIENELPESLTVSISLQESIKNLALAKEIHTLTNSPLMEIVRKLSKTGPDSTLVWELSSAVNSLERAQQVRIIKQVVTKLQDSGITPILTVTNSKEELDRVTQDDLDILESKCLTP